MPHQWRHVALVPLLAACLIAAGCSATHTVVLKGDGSGTMTMHLEVSKLLHDYIAGLAEVAGQPSANQGGVIFDLGAVRRGFADQPGVTVLNAVSPDPRSLDVDIVFNNLSELFASQPGLKGANLVALTQADGLETLRIHLDRSNYSQVASFFPMLEDPTVKSLGPQVDQKTSEDDYFEMIRFSLGDDGPGLVKKSTILISIRPDGEIVSQTGGAVSEGAVVFSVPLLRVLLLAEPLDLSVTFRPAANATGSQEKKQ